MLLVLAPLLFGLSFLSGMLGLGVAFVAAAPGMTVTATATLTLALPKPGLFTGQGPERAGRIYLGDLGLPEALYTALGISVGQPFSGGRIVLLDRTE